MSTHRTFAASAAHRWVACTASHTLEAQAGPRPSSRYADEGTRAHDLAARILTGGEIPIGADLEMLGFVKVYTDYILSQTEVKDRRVEFSADLVPNLLGGTTDCVYQRRDTLHVCDLKYGRGVIVDPVENEQLMIYALSCLPYYPTARQAALTIVQPRAPGDTIKTWRVSIARLNEFRARVFEAIRQIQSGETTFNRGEHCRFCAVQSRCPAYFDLISDAKLGDPRQVLDHIDEIRALCNAVEKEFFGKLSRGENVPGWKLVQKNPRTKWIVGAIEALKEIPGATVLEPIGITEARKLLDKETIDKLTTRESSGLAMVPESDKRPAADLSNQFEVINEEHDQ